jgi:Raf kinase inhibitor-like YbhB/YbcL family protein
MIRKSQTASGTAVKLWRWVELSNLPA